MIVVRLSAGKRGSVSFVAALRSAHLGSTTVAASKDTLSMAGQVAKSAIRFEARLLVKSEHGRQEEQNGRIAVANADAATLILTGATYFRNYRDVSGDPVKRNDDVLARVRGKGVQELRSAHVADHRSLFRRVMLDLGDTPARNLPTDERIRQFASGNDPQLVALLFQYRRYLMIGSSRAGGQPANLQGLRKDSNHPPWGSKYTVNINTEMNYWPVEVANFAPCFEPLSEAMKDVAASGAKTARE